MTRARCYFGALAFTPRTALAIIRFTAAIDSPPWSVAGIVANPMADAFLKPRDNRLEQLRQLFDRRPARHCAATLGWAGSHPQVRLAVADDRFLGGRPSKRAHLPCLRDDAKDDQDPHREASAVKTFASRRIVEEEGHARR